jgi:lysozyme
VGGDGVDVVDEVDEAEGEPLRQRRRWPFVAGGLAATVVVLLIMVAIGWVWWLPHYRPALRDDERYGVDVSHHQGRIDWDEVAADDIAFAYIKATEGGDHVDRSFAANWDGAGAAGLDRGAYHFFTLCRSGREQAENFLATVPEDRDVLPPGIDLELAGNCSDRPSRDRVEREVDAFLDAVEEVTGQPVVLYVGADFEGRYHLRDDLRDGLDRPVWHRRIFLRPDLPSWWIWQFSARSSVAGIDGPADLDVMRGTAP